MSEAKKIFENPQVLERIRQMSPEQLQKLIKRFPVDEQEEVSKILEELKTRKIRALAQDDFMEFVGTVWPTFIHGRHHERMARAFEEVANGTVKRLIINMPPRHTKSELRRTCCQLGFWVSFRRKKSFKRPIQLNWRLGSVEKCEIWWILSLIRRFFPSLSCKLTQKRLVDGTQTSVATILRLVWAAR